MSPNLFDDFLGSSHVNGSLFPLVPLGLNPRELNVYLNALNPTVSIPLILNGGGGGDYRFDWRVDMERKIDYFIWIYLNHTTHYLGQFTLGGHTGVQVTPTKLIFAFLLFFYLIWFVKLFVNNLYTFRDARGTCADI